MPLSYDPVLPTGSVILVTGVNGFLGSHIANQLLLAGYKVRGQVRDAKKNISLQEVFDERYSLGRFDLVEVKDLSQPGALDLPLQGKGGQTDGVLNVHLTNGPDVSGVAHTASDVSLNDNPNVVITGAIQSALNVIKAAAAVSTIKRFVYLSSTAAAYTVNIEEDITIRVDRFNEWAKRKAWEPPPYDGRGPHVYEASKAETEEALWKFVREERPRFTFNTGSIPASSCRNASWLIGKSVARCCIWSITRSTTARLFFYRCLDC